MTEQEYVKRLANEAHDTVDLLSSQRKGELERRVCAAFLRCLRVDFSPEEIATPESDPPDVVFRGARFEVMTVLDEGRKMQADWKNEASRRDAAETLEDLGEPYTPSVAMPAGEVVFLVNTELNKKASHYGSKTCSGLDALVYLNLLKSHLYPLSDVKVPLELRSQGWRSVCFVFPPCSSVVCATPEAPNFLRQLHGQVRMCDLQQWQIWDRMFDI